MNYTYEDVKKLIISEEIEGQQIKIKLKAPNQPQAIDTIAMVLPDPEEMQKKVMSMTKKSVATSAGVSAASSIAGNLVGGIGGRIINSAGSVASSAAASKIMNVENLTSTEITQERKEAAILQAFAHLTNYYELVDGNWIFKS